MTLPDDVREKVRWAVARLVDPNVGWDRPVKTHDGGKDSLGRRLVVLDEPVSLVDGPVAKAYAKSSAIIDAFLRALSESDHVVVPREPTEERIKAVEFALYRHADCSARDAERAAPQVYLAAIAASEEKG